eukprot:TRINITY_DN73514_c0_g1_i1.p1 TRINITY_DN73514_c0_g1~~TRINITY_DN73514_c0_g1_i1.p1  ORF type:complete len:847 (+),score=143.12 TRINITY_DN73514_c0_g1_i1:74-2614(+)
MAADTRSAGYDGCTGHVTNPAVVQRAALDKPLPTIFVSIPSYRDPECQYTVLDLFRKSCHPERIFVGICWQVDRTEDKSCFLLDLTEFDQQVRIVDRHYSEARGPCFARALIEKELFRGEDYVLQLDSHYRMIQHWDEELIRQLRCCSSDKPILTTYPSSYTLPEDYVPGGSDSAELNPNTHPVVMCAREFGRPDGFWRTGGKLVHAEQLGDEPAVGLFWAAGFAFSSSAVYKEVPYDGGLEDLFFGEEPAMACRLWTSGWDFFAPTTVIGYHLWTRKHRPVFRELACAEQELRAAASQERVHALLRGDAVDSCETLSLGSQRSLSDYQQFCGVNFSERTLNERALRGGHRASAFVDGDPVAAILKQISGPHTRAETAIEVQKAANAVPFLHAMPSKVSGTIASLMQGSSPESTNFDSATSSDVLQRLELNCGRPDKAQLLRRDDINTFNRQGFVVIDNFLENRVYSSCGDAAAIAPLIVRRGLQDVPLRSAKLGRGNRQWSSSVVRGDEIAWLSAPAMPVSEDGVEWLHGQVAERVCQSSLEQASSAFKLTTGGSSNSKAACSEFDAITKDLMGCYRETTGTSTSTAVPAASSDSSETQVFEVLLEKTSGQKLGISFSSASGEAFCIVEKVSIGLVNEWNSAHPKSAIHPDDLIVEANSVTGGDAIRQEIRRDGVLRLKLQRPNQKEQKEAAANSNVVSDGPFYKDLDVILVQLARLRRELDEVCSLGSKQMQVMVARYPGNGARYARHLDALPEHVAAGNARRLTCLYYANPNWKDSDGGSLRLHLPASAGTTIPGSQPLEGSDSYFLDVEPVLDRLVIFGSAWLEHEVLPTHTDRYTMTAWIY